MTNEPLDLVALLAATPGCPLPAVGAWRWYPTQGQDTRLPGVVFCRLHEVMAKDVAENGQLPGHYLHRDLYADGQDTVRCGLPALYYQPFPELDESRIEALVDEARSVLSRLSGLTANVRGVSQPIGNEDAVLDALVGLAADVAAEVDVVLARVEARRG